MMAHGQRAVPEEHRTNLHALIFPLLAHGHMIPLCDTAHIFAAQDGVRVTIVTTPANSSVFTKTIEQKNSSSSTYPTRGNINVEIIPFPGEKAGLPPGVENAEHLTDFDESFVKFLQACEMLREPLEAVIDRIKPSFIISDMLYPWTTEVASQFGIPRLIFHGSSFFSMSVGEVIMKERPHERVSSDEEEFVIPGLPDNITMTRPQMSPEILQKGEQSPIMKTVVRALEAERKSFGILMNSFYELESKYADYYREVLGKTAWTIGPVSLWNRRDCSSAKSRGKKTAIDEQECLRWLDSKPANSVIYVSFGSIAGISSSQLREIAVALEASNQNFIWVVRTTQIEQREKKQVGEQVEDRSDDGQGWLPDLEYEERNKGKGLIIRGWAPQVLILDHPATGVFVTHCGWNSILEGVAAGMSMVTWPVFAEQFTNEKLVTQVIKTGVPVGSNKFWIRTVNEVSVTGDSIRKALERVTVGDEATEIRRRAEEMKELAWKAVQRGGSSHQALNDLLDALRSY